MCDMHGHAGEMWVHVCTGRRNFWQNNGHRQQFRAEAWAALLHGHTRLFQHPVALTPIHCGPPAVGGGGGAGAAVGGGGAAGVLGVGRGFGVRPCGRDSQAVNVAGGVSVVVHSGKCSKPYM